MQFKHPELLYALVLLIIPILIHLFQLRRFQKEDFTNVKFLKMVIMQTRKSSQLKKWLTLLTRCLIFACLILAFVQPFIPNSEAFNTKQETVIYLDNSYSMQAKGSNGNLLNASIQQLISDVAEDDNISIFTNDKTYKNTTLKALKKELIGLPFSNIQLDYNTIFLKGQQLFSKSKESTKNFILVSDFQQKNKPLSFTKHNNILLKAVQPKPVSPFNVSIDSVYITNTSAETIDIKVKLSNSGDAVKAMSLSLYNNDILLAKSAVNIDTEAETIFTVPINTKINGRVVLEDASLQYDNTFYFNINQKAKIKVLAINESADTNFLKRIYTEDEFDYQSFKLQALNFNSIPEQNLIVLNELETINNALISALQLFLKDGGSLVVIPSNKGNQNSYNQLFQTIKLPTYTNLNSNEKRITTINFDHPLLVNQFYKRVTNFQYPKVNSSFTVTSKNNAVLSFEDNQPFLIGINNCFVFTSSLNTEQSNFKNSPLIVPVLYTIGLQSLKRSQLYYTIGETNEISVATTLGQDDILTLVNGEETTIPQQQTFSKSVLIKTESTPNKAGIYSIKNKEETLQNISLNLNRDESVLSYHNLSTVENITLEDNVSDAINSIKSVTQVSALWKWFAIFALIFLFVELLILKFFK